MVRKGSRKPGQAAAAATPSASSSPRSNGASTGQRGSVRANDLQSSTRRASLLYQIYDSSSVNGAASAFSAPSPSHAAAVIAAAAVLANPTGQEASRPSPNVSSAGQGETRHGQGASAASGGSGVRPTAQQARKVGRNGPPSSANTRTGLKNAEQPAAQASSPTTTAAVAPSSASSASSRAAINHTTSDDTVLPRPFAKGGSYANENPRLVVSEPLPATSTATASPSSATFRSRVARKADDAPPATRMASSRSLPRDASQLSTESGASGRSGTSGSRPRALSLPRTRESVIEVLPRLRPVRGSDSGHTKGSTGELLRPSPPPPPPPAGIAPSASSSSGAGGAAHGRPAYGDADVAEPREVLSAPPSILSEITKSTSPRQLVRRNRQRNEAAAGGGGGGSAGILNGRHLEFPAGSDTQSEGGDHRGSSGATRSTPVKAQLASAVKGTHLSPVVDEDDENWGDPENGPEDAAGDMFGSTQLLSSLRPTPRGDVSNTAHNTLVSPPGGSMPGNSLQQPRQPTVPSVARPHPSPSPALDSPPAYKFNVVLSSGKAATVPISLIAGSGCVQGMRPTMEDAHFIELNATHVRGQPVSLMAVLDGHCGRRVADLGAKWLPHYVLHHAALGENNALALVESILQTDREIFHVLQAKKNELEQQRKAGRNTGRRRRDVYEEMMDETAGANGGSTLITAAVCGRMLYVACLGDARAVLYDGQTTIAMSEDHKPGNAEESRRIAKCGGFVQFGRVCGILAVSRALGDFEFKFQPSSTADEEGLVTDFPFGAQRGGSDGVAAAGTSSQPSSQANRRFISNRDLMVSNVADVRQLNLTDASAFLLLACDGLWDVLSNEEATEFVRDFLSYTPDVCDPRILSGDKPRPAPEVIRRVLNNCCQKLTEFAVDRGSMDNVSAMVLFFHDVVDTVARFNGRQASVREPNSNNTSSVMSGTSSRGTRTRQARGSVQPSSTSSSFELTNNQLKVRNGRVVARR